jgi:hypothetical protein
MSAGIHETAVQPRAEHDGMTRPTCTDRGGWVGRSP